MDIIEIATNIEKLIKKIGETRREIENKGKARAQAISDYDKALAIAMATLRNDKNYILYGKEYPQPPTTLVEKLAKGICSQQRYDLEVAESGYKATISNLQALQAQLNGFQSLFRHMEYTQGNS